MSRMGVTSLSRNRRLLREAMKHGMEDMKRHPWMVAVSVLSTALCLFWLVGFLVALRSAQGLLPPWVSEPKVVVYLHGHATAQDRESFLVELRNLPEVQAVRSQSEQEALTELREQLGEWRGILDGVGERLIPPRIEVQLKAREVAQSKTEELLQSLSQHPLVAQVHDGRVLQERVGPILTSFKLGGFSLLGILLSIAVLTTSACISASVSYRRDELEVLELLGASRLQLQLPFYLQGSLWGVAASLLSGTAMMLCLRMSKEILISIPLAALDWNLPDQGLLSAGIAATGLGLSFLGCWLSLRNTGKRPKWPGFQRL